MPCLQVFCFPPSLGYIIAWLPLPLARDRDPLCNGWITKTWTPGLLYKFMLLSCDILSWPPVFLFVNRICFYAKSSSKWHHQSSVPATSGGGGVCELHLDKFYSYWEQWSSVDKSPLQIRIKLNYCLIQGWLPADTFALEDCENAKYVSVLQSYYWTVSGSN